MGKEREQKRNFALALSLVLVAAMFSFYLQPTTTGQFYRYESAGALDGSPKVYGGPSLGAQVQVSNNG